MPQHFPEDDVTDTYEQPQAAAGADQRLSKDLFARSALQIASGGICLKTGPPD